MNRLPVYILAGGRSSRFGSDKARAILDGRPLIQRVADLLSPVASAVTVVADRKDKYSDLGFRTIVDLHPGLGPLAGLETALADLPAESRWLLLCCCDAAIIQSTWLDTLLAARSAQHEAIVFAGKHAQPMPGLYAHDAVPIVTHHLKSNQRSMQHLLRETKTLKLPLPDDWPENWQINTPEDHQKQSASIQKNE